MPEISTVHQNQALTNVAIAYPVDGFISPRLIPEVSVKKKTDVYYIFDAARRGAAPVDDTREPGALSNVADFEMTTDSYDCEGHYLKRRIPDEERANSDPPIAPDYDATEYLVGRLLVNQDTNAKVVLDAALTGDYTSDPTHEWDDYTNGDPFNDVETAINQIEDGCGMTPNVMSMDSKVFRALKDHPDIVERVIYGGGPENPALVGPRAVAAVWGLDEIIVGKAQSNSAVQGQTASMSRIWGSDVYVMFRPNRPALRTPACAYRFVWKPFAGSRNGFAVEKFRDPNPDAKSDVINVGKYHDQVVTCSTAGYRLQNRLT